MRLPPALLVLLALLLARPSLADTSAPAPAGDPTAAPAEGKAAPAFHWTPGPAKIDPGHGLTMDLPAGDLYLGGDEAKTLLAKNGNFQNENLLGIVVATDESSDWMVTVRFAEDGYVKDDEELDATALLKALKEGTEEANKERVAKGFDPLTMGEWRELPRYDRSVHHLVWGVDVSTKKGTSVNYSTRILGRRGWVALNLLSPPDNLDANKPSVAALLAVTSFNPGDRYEDYKAGKDKVAEYGLAGLVLGGVGLAALKVAKVGLIAKFWNVILAGLIAFKKALVLGLAAIGTFFRKIFGKKPAKETGAAPR